MTLKTGENAKKIAAEKAVEKIRNGMVVGLGSGSTAFFAIQRIGEKVKEGLSIQAVATSLKSESIARDWNIPILPVSEIRIIDLDIDGADQVDTKGNLIKGGGGSLLREKIIAYASQQFHVVIDESKLVDHLGNFPLPVEIIPFAAETTLRHLTALGCIPKIRKVNGETFITDNDNLIADCQFKKIDDPARLDVKVKMIPGVVETGLFSNKIVSSILVGYSNGQVREIFPE